MATINQHSNTFKNTLDDILSLELNTLEAVARARAHAAATIERTFRKSEHAAKNPSPWIRLAVQFISRRNAILEHALRAHFRPITASTSPQLPTATSNTSGTPDSPAPTHGNRRQRRAAARKNATPTSQLDISCNSPLKDHTATLV